MFSTEAFIKASRQFVCVRLESYESKEHQDLVRSFLDGRFENTAFCVLAPDGKERLTRSSRSPSHVIGGQGRGPRSKKGNNDAVIAGLNDLAKNYQKQGDDHETVLQDFHTFRQALNVASGDQRLLVFVAAAEAKAEKATATLQPVFADEDVVGRFHLDFADATEDAKWAEAISETGGTTGIFVIQADQFGQEGKVVAQLPLDADGDVVKAALLKANDAFAKSEKRKIYSEHVSAGRREGIHFENDMPYGEDRDGDGKIDHVGGPKGKGGMKGKGKGKGKGRPADE